MSFESRTIPTPQERRERYRDEMISAILDAAREIMREEGAGGLNLSELARRVNLTTPALYGYFENKFALYDALYRLGIQMMSEFDQQAWREHPPGWDRIRAWFGARLTFALQNPELYHLMFSSPVPGFTPSREAVALSQRHLALSVQNLSEIIAAGVITPTVPTNRAVDLLLAIRHGILSEQLGKANVVPPDSGRFEHLIDDAIVMLQRAWSSGADSYDRGGDAPG